MDVTSRILDDADLPPLVTTVIRPWVIAIETGTLGMREVVTLAATSTAKSLKRRVVVLPPVDMAIDAALKASVGFAEALDKREARVAEPRAAALAALVAVIEQLRTVEPSEDTRALGLGW
ncbi:hypothetical protein [Methylobacterium sp. WL6]|uniref:hypothetical protein n=1 Tax=Methylobacterium sp. WL6 TaxID=2603901 RepID=UPI0011C7F6F2|nr:hypothetical protein [Methylobacterium sp. WL6]TXN71465.1 hypothetical protein FV230_08375 [Methylobacterium sp. WL6]